MFIYFHQPGQVIHQVYFYGPSSSLPAPLPWRWARLLFGPGRGSAVAVGHLVVVPGILHGRPKKSTTFSQIYMKIATKYVKIRENLRIIYEHIFKPCMNIYENRVFQTFRYSGFIFGGHELLSCGFCLENIYPGGSTTEKSNKARHPKKDALVAFTFRCMAENYHYSC